MKQVVGFLVAGALFGCGAFVPTVDLTALSASEKHEVRKIGIYDQNLLQGKSYKILNIVEGHSCKNKTWDPPATRTAAIDQLKYFAYESGANGISDVQCSNRERTSLTTNCWDLISCTANALKVDE